MVSTAFNTEIINAAFNGGTLSASTWYIGFSTANVTTNGSIDSGTEPDSSIGYSRIAMSASDWSFTTTNGKLYVKNKEVITFPEMTDNTQVGAIFLSRTATGTNCDIWQNLTNITRVDVNCTLSIAKGGISICLVNSESDMT